LWRQHEEEQVIQLIVMIDSSHNKVHKWNLSERMTTEEAELADTIRDAMDAAIAKYNKKEKKAAKKK
jgi:hypothetical protein